MASTTETLVLGHVCSKIGSGATPKGGKEVYLAAGPFALIRSQNVLNSGFSKNGLAYISEEQAKALDGVTIEQGDVLLNITGDSVARVCQVPNSALPARVNQHVAIIRPRPAVLDPSFLRYFLVSPEQQTMLLTLASSGATRNALTKGMIEQIEVPTVPIEEQKQIARILASFDDRIEHNRTLTDNLEAIARRLFKAWFVDFDPVRAQAAGEKPAGLADDLAALFPDRFVGSELGEIPEGWACNKVSELCETIFSGGTPHTQTPGYWGGSLPWLSSGETRSRFIVETEKTITQIGVDNSSTRKARAGDVVIASAGQGATRGQTSLLALDTYINQSVVALRASKEAYSSALLFLDLSSRYDEMRSISDSHSSRGSLTTKLLGSMLSVAPPKPVVVAFDALVSPMIERIVVAERENSRLGTIRDLLLPRLVSGKLSVTDAESLIEEVIV